MTALAAFHHHTGVPVMVTETSDNGSHEHRGAWMADSTSAVLAARSAGLPVVGYTWFPVFSLIDWRWRRGPYERVAYWRHMGLWDLDEEMRRHRTPLVDQFAANSVPAGHGHVYGSGVVDGWAAVAAPPGWTVADTVRLRALLDGAAPR